jgi:hypothetical protein
MKSCKNCGESFPTRVKVDGQIRNLCSRKFCLNCSPFGGHNTKSDFGKPPKRSSTIPYKDWPQEWKDNNTRRIQNSRNERRNAIIKLLGGKCTICEYSKCGRSLHCHHRDPRTKSFNLSSRQICTRSWETVKKEAQKCVLLCSNCHGEVHDGITSLP